MKLLFDQNLSRHLPNRLTDLFPQSAHVQLPGLERSSDDQIWDYAKTHGYCVVTHDADFAERSRLYGSPPKVLWLRCSNCTPQQVESSLRRNASLINELSQNPDLNCLELF